MPTSLLTSAAEKVFIAAMFHDNEDVLPYWTDEIVKVIHYLGTVRYPACISSQLKLKLSSKANVFVSIVESHSKDRTPFLLEEFDQRLSALNVSRYISTRDVSIERPTSMDTSSARIEYLAAVRNQVLEPLVRDGGYERVLFSNDVYVRAESIIDLLNTRSGDWDMVCGVDVDRWGCVISSGE